MCAPRLHVVARGCINSSPCKMVLPWSASKMSFPRLIKSKILVVLTYRHDRYVAAQSAGQYGHWTAAHETNATQSPRAGLCFIYAMYTVQGNSMLIRVRLPFNPFFQETIGDATTVCVQLDILGAVRRGRGRLWRGWLQLLA